MNLKMPWASAFVSILATFTPANAQTPTEPPDPNSETIAADEQKAPVEIIPLRQWRYEALYADGWSMARQANRSETWKTSWSAKTVKFSRW